MEREYYFPHDGQIRYKERVIVSEGESFIHVPNGLSPGTYVSVTLRPDYSIDGIVDPHPILPDERVEEIPSFTENVMLKLMRESGFRITKNDGFYEFKNLPHRSGQEIIDFLLASQLMDNGESHTQKDWIAITKGSYMGLIDFSVYLSSLIAITLAKKHSFDASTRKHAYNITQMLEEDFFRHFMMTGTMASVGVSPKHDFAVHDYGSPNSYRVAAAISGDYGPLRACQGAVTALYAMGEIGNSKLVHSIFIKFCNSRAYLYRATPLYPKMVEAPVMLGVDDLNQLSIVCLGFGYGPARGGMVTRREAIQKK